MHAMAMQMFIIVIFCKFGLLWIFAELHYVFHPRPHTGHDTALGWLVTTMITAGWGLQSKK